MYSYLATASETRNFFQRIEASIHIFSDGSDVDILKGEKISFRKRLWGALQDRFIEKFIPAFVTVVLATQFMTGTPALLSAQIGLVFAIIGALVDAMMAAAAGDLWKWKENK